MEHYRIITPEGTRDKIGTECTALRGLEATLAALFSRAGFTEAGTPQFEFYELFQQARNPIAPESLLKFTANGGQLLVLRPDSTLPLARIAATKLAGNELPARFFYAQSVYRSPKRNGGGDAEIRQCGLELFGLSGLDADAEILSLAIDALDKCGVSDYVLQLGGEKPEYLNELINLVGNGKIRLEPNLKSDIDYYTGIVFSVFTEGSGGAILAGGRYDKLCADFGRDIPAAGFAVYTDRIANLKPEPQTSETLRIAVTKGRLLDDTLALFSKAGYSTPQSLLDKDDRRLIHDFPGSCISVVLAKAADVVTYVEHGVCQLGIVGSDTLAESGGTYTELRDLGFGACKFSLAGPEGSRAAMKNPHNLTIASKYPNVTKAYFTGRGIDVTIIKIDGSVELAPLLGLSDAIVDIVSTGATLEANGLRVIDDIRPVSARLIANNAALRLRSEQIEGLMGKLAVG
ncbi:MAG: ATP phosphoribosyltransferase [Oscillospiraceae bacterium]|jgi:ATP phosphoribosyltransferase|nr:ATP phosphoribosyltransferase [Oscillospiraceae bacterium]